MCTQITTNTPDNRWRSTDIVFSFITAIIVITGVMYSYISLVAFALCLLYFSICALQNKMEKVFYLLLFLLPFACVFKVSPGSTSLYTYIELYGCFLLVLKFRKIKKIFLTIFLLYTTYTFWLCGNDITTLIKQCLIPLFVYHYFHNTNCSAKSLVLSYTSGLLFSSLFGLFYNEIPNLTNYIELDRAYELEGQVVRFSGLYNDPNYYSAAMILAVSCLLFLYIRGELKISSLVLCVAIVLFGVQTVSKSFIIMLASVYLIFTIVLFIKRDYFTSILFACILFLLGYMVIAGKISIFNNILERLSDSKGNLTTGRSELWMEYIEYFIRNPLKLIFGTGLSSKPLSTHYPHNTYIDFMFFYGIIGTLLFVCSLIVACNNGKKNRKRIENYIPICCMACMFMFLSGVKSFDLVFVLIITIYFLKFACPDKKEVSICKNSMEENSNWCN